MYVLSLFGILYILDILNRNVYKLLPKINISDFFNRKLGIKEVCSLKEYALAKIKIYSGLKNISTLKDDDICSFDMAALYEVKQYINDLRPYIKKLVINGISLADQVNSHIRCTLEHGVLDFYFIQNNSFMNSVSIRFKSFSEDGPILEISSKGVFYTYKIKSKKHIRFIYPNIKLINDIKQTINRMQLNSNCNECLQRAA